jgi:hypothetical protein
MKTFIIISLAFILFTSFLIQAGEVTKTGTTAAPFLGIGVGARAIGMGSAFVAVANDVTAMYWNPSGIASLDQIEVIFSHTKWIADVSFNYTAIAVPLGSHGVLGINATFLTMDEMEITTIPEPEGTGETFDAGSSAFCFSYARNLTDRFSIGFNVKYIHEKIYHCTAQGVAFDLGTLFKTKFNGLAIGMSIANYGTKMRMSGRDTWIQHDPDPLVSGNNPNINASLQTDAFDLPLLFRIGMAVDVLKGRGNSNMIVSVDAQHPNDDRESLNLGGEYMYNNMFALRAGYNSLFLQDSEQGLCLGGGIRYELTDMATFFIDYAYQDFGMLNEVQKFSIRLQF